MNCKGEHRVQAKLWKGEDILEQAKLADSLALKVKNVVPFYGKYSGDNVTNELDTRPFY